MDPALRQLSIPWSIATAQRRDVRDEVRDEGQSADCVYVQVLKERGCSVVTAGKTHDLKWGYHFLEPRSCEPEHNREIRNPDGPGLGFFQWHLSKESLGGRAGRSWTRHFIYRTHHW